MIVEHLIERNYNGEIDTALPFPEQVIELTILFRQRLVDLVVNWIRVGYCQGNFNSDNCAAGGYTLDYGPFGFCEPFDPSFQPWTGGGEHFSFFNQPAAAEANFNMFWKSVRILVSDNDIALAKLDAVREGFAGAMSAAFENMWAQKLGMKHFDESFVQELLQIMIAAHADYTMFFRRLSHIPESIESLKESFYTPSTAEIDLRLTNWLERWRTRLTNEGVLEDISSAMKRTNPKYAWREWLVVPAYQQAENGDYSLIRELQGVFNNPYDEHSPEIEAKYDRLRPREFLQAGGISHYSCSS
jgi:uncharacterized protein YdiU (UPF0061 family)